MAGWSTGGRSEGGAGQGQSGEEGGVVTLLGVYVENGIHNEVNFIVIVNKLVCC